MGGSRQTITAGVHKLAGIFFHVQALDADLFEISVLALFSHLHLDPTLFRDRLVVLSDLVVLREIRIEILLAIELAVLRNVQIQAHRSLDRILEHLLVQHRQRSRQTTNHRINVGVGIIPKGGGSCCENLAVGAQLHMGFKADHSFPGLFSRCRCRHPLRGSMRA